VRLAWIVASAALMNVAACVAEPASEEPGERLIGQPPGGWHSVGATNTGGIRTAQFVPDGDDHRDWFRRITFESLADQPLDPIAFLDLIEDEQKSTCEDFQAFPTFTGFENGYPTAVRLLICDRDRGTGRQELRMIKAIQGNDYFYVISRARREPPEPPPADGDRPSNGVEDSGLEEEVAAWSIYLKSIVVCDVDLADHPCPTRQER